MKVIKMLRYQLFFHKVVTCRARPKEMSILKRRGSKKWKLNLVSFLVMPWFESLTQGKRSCQKLYMNHMIDCEFKMEELSPKRERVTSLRNILMQLNISTSRSLGHPMINGTITKQLIPNLYSYNFYITSNIKTKDLKTFLVSFQEPIGLECGSSFMIKRFKTLDNNPIPISFFTIRNWT